MSTKLGKPNIIARLLGAQQRLSRGRGAWLKFSGLALTLLVMGAIELGAYKHARLVYPGLYLFLPVIYSSLLGGLTWSLISSVLVAAVNIHLFFFLHGKVAPFSGDFFQVLAVSLLFPLLTLAISYLRKIQVVAGEESALERDKEELDLIMDNLAEGVVAFDLAGKVIYANEQVFGFIGKYFRLNSSELDLKAFLKDHDIFDERGKLLAEEEIPLIRAKNGQRAPSINIRTVHKGTGQTVWLRLRSAPIFDSDNNLLMVVDTVRDITPSKLTELSLKKAQDDQEFLAQATQILSSSLEYENNLLSVARLAVPHLADWCMVDLIDDEGLRQRLDLVHYHPEKQQLAQEFKHAFPLNSTGATAQVIKTGRTLLYPNVTEEMLEKSITSQKQKELLKEIGLKSLLVVPIKAGGKILGAISFAVTDSGRQYNASDQALAEEVARRAALVVENALLFRKAHEHARTAIERSSLLEDLLFNLPIGFALLNVEGVILKGNNYLAQILGGDMPAMTDKPLAALNPNLGARVLELLPEIWQGAALDFEFNQPSNFGGQDLSYWHLSLFPVFRENRIDAVGLLVTDVTEKRASEEEIRHQALHDILTGLPNRKNFEWQLNAAIDQAAKHSQMLGVMFLDLDHFKEINDSIGHAAGDMVLKEVAARLTSCLRQEDVLGRLGGDEFTVLLKDIHSSFDATRVAEKILAALSPALRIQDQTFYLSASVGVALYPQDGATAEMLIRHADAALYRAKESGRARVAIYSEKMGAKNAGKLDLSRQLRQAVENDELRLHYQPVVNIKTREVVGMEALLRWQHPELGLLKPQRFMALAEESGLIVKMGKWVLEQAAKECTDWHAQGFNFPVMVNLSARQFSEGNLVEEVSEALSEYNLPPRLMHLEITESIAMQNIDQSSSKLRQLSSLGLQITIDDFGTGYSSLNYLKRFPINALKIDKSFVRHCLTDEHDTAIIRAIVSMAKSLNLKVIAEGVSSDMQLAFLSSLGCDSAQGFLISAPLPPEKMYAFLKTKQALQLASDSSSSVEEK